MASVKLLKINKALDKNPILRGITLEIENGELVVLVGPSGCGKSTLLRTLAGLETPDEGEIWIGERRVDQLDPRERNIAMVFQSYALYPHMNVRDNLSFALRLRKQKQSRIDQRVQDVASMLGIEMLLERFPRQLSGGQRQRVAMGRALVREADVFLLDEPLSNLDAALRTQTRIEIKRLHTRIGATMIYVTHDQVEAMTLADRLVVLRFGEVMQVGTPAQLFDQPDNTFVATFLGSPPMNLLKAHVEGAHLRSDGLDLPGKGPFSDKQQVIVGVRPHDLVPVLNGAEPSATGVLRAVVDAVEPLGWDANVHCSLGEQKLIARADATVARQLRDGQEVEFRIAPRIVHVFDVESTRAICHGIDG